MGCVVVRRRTSVQGWVDDAVRATVGGQVGVDTRTGRVLPVSLDETFCSSFLFIFLFFYYLKFIVSFGSFVFCFRAMREVQS